ncbi:GNAT family N-acetyltransferase [Thalassospira sp.]|uniref:GNAT family N-acetyltransferase n=1 Tax=Thalassospira sp. TaxID=1912094 RepID=UPI0032EDA1EA
MFDICLISEWELEKVRQAACDWDTCWAWHDPVLQVARAQWRNTTDLGFLVLDKTRGDKILAIVPLVLVLPHKFSTLTGGYLESTGGPAIDPNLPAKTVGKTWRTILAHFKDTAKNFGSRRLDISCPPLSRSQLLAQKATVNPLCHLPVSDSSSQTWILQLDDKSEDDLWRNLEHRSRKQINKGRRQELSHEWIKPSPKLLETYVALHEQTCKRNKIPSHPEGYFLQIFGRISADGLARTGIIRCKSKVIAIQNFLRWQDTALYWTTACEDQALQLCANDFGMWHAILALKREGVVWLECGEAFPGAQSGKLKGLNDFKKSFGGTLYPYFRGTMNTRPVIESIFNVIRHLRKGC